MLVLDIHDFRRINACHGLRVGDSLLRQLAERLRAAMGDQGRLGYMGAGEFACGMSPADGAMGVRIAQAMLATISAPFLCDGGDVILHASIGLASGERTPADELLRAAGVAMACAKRAGVGRWLAYEPAMDMDLRTVTTLERDFPAALARGEIVPVYQPIYAMRSGQLVGFESLARWIHPGCGMIYPRTLIPIAEKMGALNALCLGLLRQSCQDAQAWPAHLTLSINLSPWQFDDPTFPLRLLQTVHANGFMPGRLVVEISRGTIPADLAAVRDMITSFRNIGMTVALDNFAASPSDLRQLAELKIDAIKIDPALTTLLDTIAGRHAFGAILDLARQLGLPVIAKGVETMQQADMLLRMGCRYCQGFGYGRPRLGATIPAISSQIPSGPCRSGWMELDWPDPRVPRRPCR